MDKMSEVFDTIISGISFNFIIALYVIVKGLRIGAKLEKEKERRLRWSFSFNSVVLNPPSGLSLRKIIDKLSRIQFRFQSRSRAVQF